VRNSKDIGEEYKKQICKQDSFVPDKQTEGQ
jgi:hypothetical protein